MRKLLCISISIIILLYGYNFQVCYAAGDPTSYKITVQKFELKRTDDTWVTISQPNQEIDLAAVDPGLAAGSLLGNIPSGTYDNFRLTISETIKVTGSDGANYTNQDGVAVMEGSAATDADIDSMTPSAFNETSETWNNTSAGEMSIQVNLDNADDDDYMQLYCDSDFTPLTVTTNSTISIWMDFDTENTVEFSAADSWGPGLPATNIMLFRPPNEGSAFSITVDGTTVTVTAANMTNAF